MEKTVFNIPHGADRSAIEARAVELLLTESPRKIKAYAIESMLGDLDMAEAYARELALFITALGGLSKRADRLVSLEACDMP